RVLRSHRRREHGSPDPPPRARLLGLALVLPLPRARSEPRLGRVRARRCAPLSRAELRPRPGSGAVSRARVLVIGAGPAGLAAATRLLEAAPDRVSVELIRMGHHNGGKAASYRGDKGLLLEHGWHMIVGFYQNLRSLMRRAGIDALRTLATMGGQQHVY